MIGRVVKMNAYDISKAQHTEVSHVVHTGKDEFTRQRQFRCVTSHARCKVELFRHDAHRIVGRASGNFHHYVGAENVRREEDPKDVVNEQPRQQEG